MRKGEVSHVVVVQKIESQRAYKSLGTAELQADAVVHARVVDERINSAERANRVLDGFRAILRMLQIRDDAEAANAIEPQLGKKFVAGFLVAIDDHRGCAFTHRGSGNRRSDALRSASDNHDFVF